jgi:molybdenum cofactor cytidylyltransferase
MPTFNPKETSQDESAHRAVGGFAVIVLAAGAPPRNGRSLASVGYRGRSLVEHATRTALASGASEVVIVAGEDHAEVRHRLRKFRVRVVRNPLASEGISSSIRAGLSQLATDPAAAIVSLCDQPKVTPAHLRALAERVLAGDGTAAVASAYDGVLGAPCAFARKMFPRLLELVGKHGARRLIREAGAAVEAIVFSDANHEAEPTGDFLPLPTLYREGTVSNQYADACEVRGPPLLRAFALAV